MYLSILFKTNQVFLILCHSCQYVCKQQSPLTRLKHLQLMLKERPDHFIARSSVHFKQGYYGGSCHSCDDLSLGAHRGVLVQVLY